MGKRRLMLIATMTFVAPLAALGISSPALAAPQGIFSTFSDCPVTTPGLALCQYGQITGGELTIGSINVPINKTLTLQGGLIPTGNPENQKEYFVIPATDGNSLSKTELEVPGGLLGLSGCDELRGRGIGGYIDRRMCHGLFDHKIARVTATAEVVANRQNPPILNLVAFSREEGVALTLPIRIHLKNPLLGKTCYIGSEASPIELHMTDGATSPAPPNKSISGTRGTPETLEENEQEALRVAGSSLVDNSFAVPAAEGCGGFLSFLVDPILNAKLKLPSPDGYNTAILKNTITLATAEAIITSETF
jgi:hypothetical protein